MESVHFHRGSFGLVTLDPADLTRVRKVTPIFVGAQLVAQNVREAALLAHLKLGGGLPNVINALSIQVKQRPDANAIADIVITTDRADMSLDRFIGVTPFAQRMLCLRGVIRQLVVGLHALHASGVVHGDLKAANVVVDVNCARRACLSFDEALDIRIIDLGSGQFHVRSPKALEQSHTYVTAAPELFTRNAPASPATDAFSLGAVIFHYINKTYPFSPDAKDQIGSLCAHYGKHTSLTPHVPDAPWPGVPQDVFDVMVGLLQVDPDVRTSVADLHSIFQLQQQPQPQPQPDQQPQNTPPLARQKEPLSGFPLSSCANRAALIDETFRACEAASALDCFALACSISDRFTFATSSTTRRDRNHARLVRASVVLAQAVLQHKSASVGARVREQIIRILTALRCDIYADTADHLIVTLGFGNHLSYSNLRQVITECPHPDSAVVMYHEVMRTTKSAGGEGGDDLKQQQQEQQEQQEQQQQPATKKRRRRA